MTPANAAYLSVAYLLTPPGAQVYIVDVPEEAGMYNCVEYLEGYGWVSAERTWFDAHLLYIDGNGDLIITGNDQVELDRYSIDVTTGELQYNAP